MDEQLKDLIARVCSQPADSPQRHKALNQLLRAIAQLPGIYRSSHQDYPEAYNRTLEWASKNIERFEVRTVRSAQPPPSVEQSFVIWINGYLKWRIRDLYTSDNSYDPHRIYPSKTADGDSLDPLDRVPDPKISLSLLDEQIAQLQADRRQRHGEIIRQQIENDPDGKLFGCHPRKHQDCHCRELAIRLLLQDPPQKISEIAREFEINNQTLYSHWKQKCLPLLQAIARSVTGN